MDESSSEIARLAEHAPRDLEQLNLATMSDEFGRLPFRIESLNRLAGDLARIDEGFTVLVADDRRQMSLGREASLSLSIVLLPRATTALVSYR